MPIQRQKYRFNQNLARYKEYLLSIEILSLLYKFNKESLNEGIKYKKKPSQPDQGVVDLVKRKNIRVIGLSAEIQLLDLALS
ncbi:hypothetical protein [Acinetobacter sp. TSRC1-2]|uniref:hypothetical protein n=1 Tax=unclassified Acinetobacter TaxID=196816 RepID=UPI003CEDB4C9